MHIKLLALFLIPTFQVFSMGINEPEKTINPQEINKLSQLTHYGKNCVKECLNGDFRACEELKKEPRLMREIKAQNPQIAAGLYIQMKKAKEYKNDKQLTEDGIKALKDCLEENSLYGCAFVLKHQKALKAFNILNGSQLNKAKDTMAQMHRPFFSE